MRGAPGPRFSYSFDRRPPQPRSIVGRKSVAHQDGSHLGICGLKSNVVFLRIVILDRGFVSNEGNDDIASLRRQLLAHEDIVAGEDARFDHRVTTDPQAEDVPPTPDQITLDSHRVEHVLLGQ